MKKILSFLLALALLLSVGAAAGAESPDYYGIGLRVTGLLSEMVQNRGYLQLFLTGDNLLDLLSTMFNTGDYDAPVAVYRLYQQDPREWMKSLMTDEELDQLNALSPALQEQVFLRVSGTALLAQLNAKQGVEVLSVVSALQALVNDPSLEEEEPVSYLFIFKKGVPVMVTYSWHQASGMFIALDAADTESQTALQAALQPYGLEALPVDIP